MAISKHPFGRYQIIDRELCRRAWVKTRELKEIIEDELSVLVSERMINEDINAMIYDPVLGYEAPIAYNKSQKAYYYTDNTYSIRAFGLKDGDINALMFYAKTINQYKEYEVFRDFSNAIEKVLDAVTIRKGISTKEHARLVVQTESTPRLTGSELIPVIVQALDSDCAIQFQYRKYNDTVSKLITLQPYLLKEDRHRWYIIGKIEGKPTPTTTYALDRMQDVVIVDAKFKPVDFDFEHYYKHSFGITVLDVEPVEVELSFTPLQGNYLKTLKMHSSQETLLDNENEFRVKVTVKPSWEFYEKILGYGESVTVLSPESIRREMRNKFERLGAVYGGGEEFEL